MRIQVLLFGPLSAELGQSSIEVELTGDPPTCGDAREALARTHPSIAPLLPSHRFARNQEIVADSEPIEADDELALIGMVSGG
ncbi:MAG: MoaD/ThiS family protein [Gemmatimonadales bacterium]|nr:MAG: MoaD/ThiS family protein [Gemmatimonadales bacterium]